jgi:hypothetical protein
MINVDFGLGVKFGFGFGFTFAGTLALFRDKIKVLGGRSLLGSGLLGSGVSRTVLFLRSGLGELGLTGFNLRLRLLRTVAFLEDVVCLLLEKEN